MSLIELLELILKSPAFILDILKLWKKLKSPTGIPSTSTPIARTSSFDRISRLSEWCVAAKHNDNTRSEFRGFVLPLFMISMFFGIVFLCAFFFTVLHDDGSLISTIMLFVNPALFVVCCAVTGGLLSGLLQCSSPVAYDANNSNDDPQSKNEELE